jgi:hypothetical protein
MPQIDDDSRFHFPEFRHPMAINQETRINPKSEIRPIK